jgi:hypothetical protein
VQQAPCSSLGIDKNIDPRRPSQAVETLYKRRVSSLGRHFTNRPWPGSLPCQCPLYSKSYTSFVSSFAFLTHPYRTAFSSVLTISWACRCDTTVLILDRTPSRTAATPPQPRLVVTPRNPKLCPPSCAASIISQTRILLFFFPF